MDQPLQPPDLLPADLYEKGKQRAQPREHTRANYGCAKASVSGSRRGSFGNFWHAIGLEPVRDELTLVAYHDRHSSGCMYFPSRVTGFWASGKEAPTAPDGTELLREQ